MCARAYFCRFFPTPKMRIRRRGAKKSARVIHHPASGIIRFCLFFLSLSLSRFYIKQMFSRPLCSLAHSLARLFLFLCRVKPDGRQIYAADEFHRSPLIWLRKHCGLNTLRQKGEKEEMWDGKYNLRDFAICGRANHCNQGPVSLFLHLSVSKFYSWTSNKILWVMNTPNFT